MRFLVDECLAPRVADLLTQAGHEAVHLGAVGLLGRPDEEVMEFARQHAQVVVSTARSSSSPKTEYESATFPSTE